MADELVFPASNTLSLIDDLASSMMNEEILAHDINPSFPQSEGSIDIPEIIPPIICPKDANTTFTQPAGEPYGPMSQLMKESGELTTPLDVPLAANINEPINFTNVQNNSSVVQEPILRQHIQSPLASNNSMNFVNPNSHVSPIQNVQNTHCLVIGGQRVPITTPNQHNSSVINIKHAANANSSLLQTTHALHSSSNVDNKLKQTMLVKAPLNEHMSIPNKPPMKGQIIKTPDQRLMFVTEVNGRRVGYLIQQPKQNNSQNNVPTQNNNNIPTQNNNIPAQSNVPNTHFSRVQASVQTFVNEHMENKKNQDNNSHSGGSSETSNVDNQMKSASPINFTLDENKEIIMRHSENITKATEPLLKTDMKSLREKLLNLRNPLNSKNTLNTKSLSFPAMHKPAEKSGDEYDNAPLSLGSPSSIETLPPGSTIENIENSTGDEIISHNEVNEESNHSNDMHEEEEGQEIEFSENDLTADIDGTDQSCSPDYEMGEGNANNEEENTTAEIRSRTTSTDDEDSVPLSMLKIDTNENSLSPRECGQEGSPSSKSKKGKNSKKVKLDGKSSKKEGKLKGKKKKDNRKPKKPIIAYQLYFRDIQKDVRSENPQMHFGEISKLVSKKWEALEESQKKKYFDTYEGSKAEYAEKIKAYKELIAQEESVSPESVALPVPQEFESNEAEDAATPKKKAKRGKKRKLADKPKSDLDNSLGENEFSIDGEHLDTEDKKQDDEQELDDNPPSSPSLPSSSSPSSEDEEDSEAAITRIREKAAELHKYLKQQRIVTQKKTKQSAKKVRPTKIEVKGLPVQDTTNDDKSEIKNEDALDTPDLMADISEMDETVEQKKEPLKPGELDQEELETPGDETSHKVEEVTDNTKDDIINNTPKDEPNAMDTTMENNVEPDNLTNKSVDHINEETEQNAHVEGPTKPKKTNSKGDSENDDISEDEVISSVSRKKSSRIKKMEEKVSPGSEKSRKGRDAKKSNSKRDSDNDDLSEDEVINTSSRKKSSRIKKMEENSPSGSEGRSRRGRDSKIEDEKTMRDSDEECTRSRRSKKKRLDYTEKSDSEEEENNNSKEDVEDLNSKNNNNSSSNNNTNEKEKPPEVNSERLPSTKELPNQHKVENAVQSKEHENKTSVNNSSSKIEETKPAVEQLSTKNTFRIPKKSGSTNDSGLLALRGPRICIRHSCEKPAVTSRERGGQYCGNECLVLYCREVFEAWVIDREMEESKT